MVGESLPDVILMDLRMPGVDGIAATERIMAVRPASRIVVLTTFDDDDHLYPALAAGAFGFLVKDSPPAELLAALRRAVDGESPFSQGVLARLVEQAVRTREPQPQTMRPVVPELSPRERDVLALVAPACRTGRSPSACTWVFPRSRPTSRASCARPAYRTGSAWPCSPSRRCQAWNSAVGVRDQVSIRSWRTSGLLVMMPSTRYVSIRRITSRLSTVQVRTCMPRS
jgi:hypothetical protein